jgi:hypothetical protein
LFFPSSFNPLFSLSSIKSGGQARDTQIWRWSTSPRSPPETPRVIGHETSSAALVLRTPSYELRLPWPSAVRPPPSPWPHDCLLPEPGEERPCKDTVHGGAAMAVLIERYAEETELLEDADAAQPLVTTPEQLGLVLGRATPSTGAHGRELCSASCYLSYGGRTTSGGVLGASGGGRDQDGGRKKKPKSLTAWPHTTSS